MKRLILLSALFLALETYGLAQVSLTVNVPSAGGLFSVLTADQRNTVTDLTINGNLDARDFVTLRDFMPVLSVLNISNVDILEYTGVEGTFTNMTYNADEIPCCAFFNTETHVGKASLNHVIMPLSIHAVSSYAFQYCENLQEADIPASVDTIRQAAFHLCHGLNEVHINAGVLYIDYEAFATIGGNIIVDLANPNYSSLDGVLFNKDYTQLIQCPDSKSAYLVPSSVSTIGVEAFAGCDQLLSVTIPESVINIQNEAFVSCKGLVSFELPSSVSSLSYGLLMGCSNLKTVLIPESIDSIGDIAFAYCTSLDDIELPFSITYIGMMSFWGCSGLHFFNFPPSLTMIQVAAFRNCTALESVWLPGSLTSISSSVFVGCTGLKKVVLPESVTSIGAGAFQNCTSLEEFHANKPVPVDLSSTNNVFAGVPVSSCILYVPAGSKALYEVADKWKDFENIVEDPYAGLPNENPPLVPYSFTRDGVLNLMNFPQGTKVRIFDVSGLEIFSGFITSTDTRIPLSRKGMIVVECGNNVKKLIN